MSVRIVKLTFYEKFSYMDVCLDGYGAFGFDASPLYDALNASLEKCAQDPANP